MRRAIEEKLIEWKKEVGRKPLLLNGIRQVGKTWSINNFGEKYFKDYIYVNFDL